MNNPNCDGSKCTQTTGEVRSLRLGRTADHGNIILCHSCYLNEMKWRKERNKELAVDCQFELPAWETLPVYK